MFQQLMPLLANRTVVITVARIDDKTLIVNVIPKQGEAKDDNAALTTPLSVTGTAEELDHELPGLLTGYVGELGKFQSNLDTIKAQLAEAQTTANEEAKRKADELKKKRAGVTPAKPAETVVKTDLFAGGSMPPAGPVKAEEDDGSPVKNMEGAVPASSVVHPSTPAPAAGPKKDRAKPIRGKSAQPAAEPEPPTPITTAALDAKVGGKDSFLDDEDGDETAVAAPNADPAALAAASSADEDDECPF